MKGFNAPSGSAHEDIDFNNYTMRQRARMLYMAAPIATSAIKTNRTNVVGVGLRLKSRIDREVLGLSPDQAERWQKETEREFSLWASNKRACDATGMNNFYGLQQLALISWLLSGDCIGLIKQYETTPLLSPRPPDRVRQNRNPEQLRGRDYALLHDRKELRNGQHHIRRRGSRQERHGGSVSHTQQLPV